mgnify:FL=1
MAESRKNLSVSVLARLLAQARETDEISFAQELKVLAAVMLHELGRLSSGR